MTVQIYPKPDYIIYIRNNKNTGVKMLKIFDNTGADIRTLPHPQHFDRDATIIRDALAAKEKEQKPCTPRQNTQNTSYIIHIIKNNSKSTKLTHSQKIG